MAGFVIENLSFTYPNSEKPALDGISLSVGSGEFALLIGRSGCGKSTLLRHLKPTLTPHGERSGRVLFDGEPVSSLDDRSAAKRIGFVFQHPDDQIVTDKVWHELAFGLESTGCERKTMRLRVSEMASYFGLEDIFHKNVSELSGGQKQLLNLASVMAMNPDALILDEPTSQLDPIAAFDFLSTVKRLNTELGITVILSEHRLEEAMQFADRVLVLEDGRLTVSGTPKETAKRLFETGSPMAGAMPAAARISLGLGLPEAALTVNEGRRAIQSLGLAKKLLPEEPLAGRDSKPVFSASELFFRYEKDGEDVLKGLDLDLFAGEIYSLVGSNGAGKSTLLSVISGQRAPYRGRISVNGKRMKGRFNAFSEHVALLPQDPRLIFTKDTVRAELSTEGAESVISLMELEGVLDRDPYDISGGEQQRAAIAKVLLADPSILLLDEPTKGMDAHTKATFGKKLRELKEKGIAILLVSHDVEFCAEYSDRAGFMFDGAVISENGTRAFFRENTFYTTAANRTARDVYENALLAEEVIRLAKG